jgi:tRNA (adenine57-N1/adenine58-N1)-methyltransferase
LVDVEEIITRRYKPVADRLRPQDRMIAHTGFLIFARAIVKPASVPTSSIDVDVDVDESAGEV